MEKKINVEKSILRDENSAVVTRGLEKIKLSSDFTVITRVQNSPLYRGISLRDKLPKETQKLRAKKDFKHALKGLML